MTEGSRDRDVRLLVYEHFLAEGSPPTSDDVAAALSLSPAEVDASFRRLEESRVFVFAPGTRDIWMAHPLSAIPTPFRVETPRGAFWGACVWDGFGTVAMLGETGTVQTSCACCGEEMALRLEEGVLESVEGVGPLRRSGAALVGQHRLHVSDDARLPVGSARGPLV